MRAYIPIRPQTNIHSIPSGLLCASVTSLFTQPVYCSLILHIPEQPTLGDGFNPVFIRNNNKHQKTPQNHQKSTSIV